MSKTIYSLWETSEKSFGDLVAVRWLNGKEIEEYTYRQFGEKMGSVRRGLFAQGFSETKLTLLGTSSPEWVCVYMGVITGRNTAVPLDAALPPADLIGLIVRSHSTGVFLDPKFAALAAPIRAKCPEVKKIWMLSGEEVEGTETLESLMEAGKDAGEVPIPAEDDLSMIVFTSGTTGKSKGVMLTQKNLYTNVEAILYKVDPGVVFLSVLPVHHAFCLVMDWLQGFMMGAVVCINDSLLHMVRNMSLFKPNVMLMVPLMIETIYKRIRASGEGTPPEVIAEKVFGGKLKTIFTGGAHLEEFYIDEFEKYGVQVLEGYGMSECSPVISSNRVHDFKKGSIGKPLPGVEISFENGEILVRSSSVMRGYYEMEEETAEALKDGWLHTGDKGYMDEDGFLFINGRVKNLIILSNGENISPEEIEGKLALNPLISEVVVTGDNNALTARIFPEEALSQNMSAEELKAALQKILDDYNREQPTYRQLSKLVIRENPFIKNSARKILRTEILRDEPVG
ncbi:MAG: AMP-binding protein [Lachnospiraceae bacterium]|nr:AMP-binding protein [Lachnospiraceae bacterium]